MKNILMNTEMTKAILDGRKVQTRRVIKSIKDAGVEFKRFEIKGNSINGFWSNADRAKKFAQPIKDFIKQEAKYQIGETIWVREPAEVVSVFPDEMTMGYQYGADEMFSENIKHISIPERFFDDESYHPFPRWIEEMQGIPNGCIKEMARIFLKITDVRVERLHDISEQDIKNEGIVVPYEPIELSDGGQKSYGNKHSLLFEWIKLWNKTAPKGYKWEDNPYVFVYEFERAEK